MTTVKAKVTARLDYNRPPSPLKANGVPPRPKISTRPPSPSKSPSPSPVTRPRAKINSSASINVRKSPQTSPSASRSVVSFRAPSPFKSTQRVDNKTVPSVTTSSISISRPPSVKPHAVQKSISSSSTVGRTDRPVVTSRSDASSPELGTRQRRASVTLHPPKPTVSGVSRTAPPSPLAPVVNPQVQCSSTLSNLRDRQPSPTPSIRITSKVTKLSTNVKGSTTSQPSTPNPATGSGHRTFPSRPRVVSVSNPRNVDNLSMTPPSRHPTPSVLTNAKFSGAGRPISQCGLHFNPPPASVTPTPASTSSSPPLRSASPLSRHRRVPSVAKSDIVHRFQPLQISGNEDVTIQAPRPVRPNIGPPSANLSPKYSPFIPLSASNAIGNPSPNLHSKSNSSPGMVSGNKFPVIAKVDPLSIPLPPNSPPSSTLSYSSRSTLSSSSVTSTSPQHSALSGIGPTLNSHDGSGLGMGMTHRRRVSGVSVNENPNGINSNVDNRTNGISGVGIKRRESVQSGTHGGIQFLQRAALEDLDRSDAGSLLDDLDPQEEDQDSSGWRMRAEAKSIRKIEDLEITNRSLMVINDSLEAAKHRQAKEIRDLRRRLRESRLILPPKAYRLVTSGQAGSTLDADLDDDDDDDDEDEDTDVDKINDEGFGRCRNLLEALLEDGRRALAAKPEDFEAASGNATKVLHAEELRSEADLDERDGHDDDADTSIMSVDHDSEDEVEGIVSIRVTTPTSQSP